MSEAALWQYIETGAGIDALAGFVDPLVREVKPGGSICDVGCGFPFMLDYARFIGASKVAGIEDAEYGKTGARSLSIPLFSQNEYPVSLYDIVCASEVVEHVNNPRKFLQSISQLVSSDGVLALTTPNSSFADETNARLSPELVFAILSPGQHTCLLTKSELQRILLEVGFSNVVVSVANERLIAYASWGRELPQSAVITQPTAYLDYLEFASRNEDPVFRGGMLFRKFKALVNSGDISSKTDLVQEQLEKILEIRAELSPRVQGPSPTQMEKILRGRPFWLGSFTFFKAQHALNRGEYSAASALFSSAISELATEVRAQILPSEGFQCTLNLEAAALLHVAKERFAYVEGLSNETNSSRKLRSRAHGAITRLLGRH